MILCFFTSLASHCTALLATLPLRMRGLELSSKHAGQLWPDWVHLAWPAQQARPTNGELLSVSVSTNFPLESLTSFIHQQIIYYWEIEGNHPCPDFVEYC